MKNGKNILIVFLILIILGLGGFIVYDKVIKEEKNEEKVETNNEEVIDTEKELITDVSNFPKESDDSVRWGGYLSELLYKDDETTITDLNQNFQDLEFKTDNGIKYTITCGVYGEENTEMNIPKCNSIEFKFDGFNTTSTYDIDTTCGVDSNIIITDKYIIEQKNGCGAGGTITVKDKKGDAKLRVENSVIYYGSSFEDETTFDKNYGIRVVDNILYYLSYDNTETSNGECDIEFNLLDLTDMKKKTIQEFKGYPAGQE